MRVIIIFNSNGIPRERITKIHKYFYLQEIERKSKKKKKKIFNEIKIYCLKCFMFNQYLTFKYIVCKN